MPQQTRFGGREYRDSARETLLEIFASANELPIGLFVERGEEIVRIASKASLDDLEEPYCRAIHHLQGGREACDNDECVRAGEILIRGEADLTLCHAGLYSQAMPIKVDGVIRAVLMFGEMRVDDEAHERRSLNHHERAMETLGVSEPQREALRRLLQDAKKLSPVELEKARAMLPRVGAWLYRLFDEEDRLQRHVEDITHELQIRLQPVLANTEILFYDLSSVSALEDRYRRTANEVLNSALALASIIQSMGDFLEEYHFVRSPIASMLHQAKQIYRAEAQRRAVDIRLHLEPVQGKPPVLEVSADHLQYAFNNLVHNAIKYSFRGGPGRPRFVRIAGRPAGDCYSIAFENYGVGILPEEIREGRIFEDGYQGELTRREYRTGSGRGLHFAYRIIKRHQGWIEVTSTPTATGTETLEGQPHLTSFVVYLPYEQPQDKVD